MSSNVHIRSNVHISGHKEFRLRVRGRLAIMDYATKHGLALTPANFTLRQTVELASEIPCAHCRVFPEGVILENGREMLCFSCPNSQCAPNVRVTEFQMNLALINRGVELLYRQIKGNLDHAGLVGLALSECPLCPQPYDPDKCILVYCRLTPVQEYIYGYRSIPERSSLANAALAGLIEREGRNV